MQKTPNKISMESVERAVSLLREYDLIANTTDHRVVAAIQILDNEIERVTGIQTKHDKNKYPGSIP